MANESSPIINIITSKLRGELSIPIYKEFNWRYAEALRMINRYPHYQVLSQDIATVEYLLALSIFYNHVIANLDGAEKFFGRVTSRNQITAVEIGSYQLDSEEVNRIRGIIIGYQKMLRRFDLGDNLSNYQRTYEFLNMLINRKELDNANTEGQGEG